MLTTHEPDRRGIRSGGFLARACAEITGRDDEPLLVSSKASSNLLDDRSLHVALPFLHLYGHSRANDITYDQGATDIDTTTLTAASNLDFLETHLCQEPRNKFLKRIPLRFEQPLMQRFAHLFVVLFDLKGKPPSNPLRKPNITFTMLNESRLFTSAVIAFDLRQNLRLH